MCISKDPLPYCPGMKGVGTRVDTGSYESTIAKVRNNQNDTSIIKQHYLPSDPSEYFQRYSIFWHECTAWEPHGQQSRMIRFCLDKQFPFASQHYRWLTYLGNHLPEWNNIWLYHSATMHPQGFDDDPSDHLSRPLWCHELTNLRLMQSQTREAEKTYRHDLRNECCRNECCWNECCSLTCTIGSLLAWCLINTLSSLS